MTDVPTSSAACAVPAPAVPPSTGGRGGWRRVAATTGFSLLLVLLAVGALGGERLRVALDPPAALRAWSTVFVSVSLQSLPFLVLGVALSAAITVGLPISRLLAWLPRRPVLAVPVAGAAGVMLPGCECASVPVTGGLIARGMPAAPALAFLLAAPAVNPVVLVATAVAFPGQPEVVVGRFVASMLAAVAMGWLWMRLGREDWLRVPRRPRGTAEHPAGFFEVMRHDLLHSGGYVVVGAMLAATVNVLVPKEWLTAVADRPWLAVLALALLAVAVAICSEADAFVAASFTQFSTTAKLAFMVVGPMVDVKLISLQAGTFGRRFAARFAPATFVVAVVSSAVVGWWLT